MLVLLLLGCETRFLWLWPKPTTEPLFLTAVSGFSHLTTQCLLHLIPETMRAKMSFFFYASIAVVLLKCLRVFSEVCWSITLMGSGLVWSWMWFWAKRHKWKGMKTDRVKHLKVKSWCSGQLWPDRCGQRNHPSAVFALVNSGKCTTVCMSVIWNT